MGAPGRFGSGRVRVAAGLPTRSGSEPTWSPVWPSGPSWCRSRSPTPCSPGCRRWWVCGRRLRRSCCTRRWAARATSWWGRCRPPRRSRGWSSAGLTGDPGRAAALTAGLALVTGLITVGAGLLRLGFLAGFVSQPVLKGFIIGLALTIVAGQLPKLFGVERVEGAFFEKVWGLSTRAGGDQRVGGGRRRGFAGAAAAPAALRPPGARRPWSWCWPGWWPRCCWTCPSAGWPSSVRSRAVCRRSGCPSSGSRTTPPSSRGAVGIALVGFAEGLAAAQTYAAKAGYDIDPDRELLAVGAANVGASLCAGMVVSGSLSKTAVNGGAGARSQASGLVVAVLTVVTLLLLTGLFERAARGHARRDRHRRRRRADRLPGPAQAVPDLDQPVGGDLRAGGPRRLPRRARGPARRAGVRHPAGAVHRHRRLGAVAGLPRVAAERRRARPHRRPRSGLGRPRARHPAAEPAAGVEVVRVEAGLFFANADHVRTRIRRIAESADPRAVVLDAETTPVDRRDRGADARRSRAAPAPTRHPPARSARRRPGPRRAAARRGARDRGWRVPDGGRRSGGGTRRHDRDPGSRCRSTTC